MQLILEKVEKWYQHYTFKISQKLRCEERVLKPYIKMSILTMTTYMMFGDKTKADAIMTIVQKGIMEILERMN